MSQGARSVNTPTKGSCGCRSQDLGRCWAARGDVCESRTSQKSKQIEDLALFLKVLQTRYGYIPEYCGQEESLREVAHCTAGRLGLPTGVIAVEQSQANGRSEQRVRALRERSQIMVEDARRCGIEIILDHPVAQSAVRRTEWIQNLLVKSDVDLSDGGRR